jgi:hypothetical protein
VTNVGGVYEDTKAQSKGVIIIVSQQQEAMQWLQTNAFLRQLGWLM